MTCQLVGNGVKQMDPMPAAVERLRFAVRTLPGLLAGFAEAEGEQPPSQERWTKKEVLGHLIDSASNNHQRFVRGQIASGQDFPGYEQEQWVRLQGYQSARWADLIDLWRAYNTHILHVIGCMSEEGKRATCRVGGREEITLAGLFVDYVDHLEHHLRKMLGRWESGAT
jgi:DinB family protein